MRLATGSALGPYEIVGFLGAGGMGEVYEALDRRIGRRVAVKILPRELAIDETRLRRFQQEARAVGALNHPNLLSLFDLGEQDGLHYLVTELLAGDSLRDRLRRGPLSPRQAVEMAQRIAEGLAAAHGHGIVHRDLKPENLFLTRDGRVKILDFGLAKLAGLDGDPGLASRSGTVVGTAAYMAPEQIQGEAVDGRADLFALGAILYELLTGESAFRRDSPMATFHAVLHAEPPQLAGLHPAIPQPLAVLVAGCLEKDREQRFQSARDLAVALRSLAGPPSLPATEAALPRRAAARRPRPRLLPGAPAVLFALPALLVGAAIGWQARRPVATPVPAAVPALRHLTRSVDDSAPAIAPDGRSVAFVSRRDGVPRVWVKELTGGGETALTAGPDLYPRFSPDGSELLFVRFAGTTGALTKIPFPGGQPRTLLRDVLDADWSPDGRQIAFVRHENPPGGAVTVVGALATASGQTRQLARIEGRLLYQPRWSPDGDRIATVEAGGERIVVVDVAAGTARPLALPPPRRPLSTAVWDGPDRLLVLEAQGDQPGVALAAGTCLRLDLRDGSAEPVFSTPNWGLFFDARGGTVVFSAGFSRQSLWEGELNGAAAVGAGRWLTRGASVDRQPAYSPDGEWVAFSSDRSGNLDLWKVGRTSGEVVRLTDDPAVDWDPAFTPSGELVWASDRGGRFRVWTAAADGSGARPVTDGELGVGDPVSVPPGEWLVFGGGRAETRGLWRVRADGSGLSRLAAGNWLLPVAAPDGTLLVARETSAEDPRVGRLVVLRWPAGEEVVTIPLSPQSLTELLLPGRSAFRDRHRLAYLGEVTAGRLGLLLRDLDLPAAPAVPLAGLGPDVLPETFTFSPDGRHLAISHLELLQNLVLAELAPRAEASAAGAPQ